MIEVYHTRCENQYVISRIDSQYRKGNGRWKNSLQIRIMTNEALREMVRHESGEFPFQYHMEDIWLYDLHCV